MNSPLSDSTLIAFEEAINDVADILAEDNRSLPAYYRDMLADGWHGDIGAHARDSFLMARLARERRYRPEQSAERRHFYRAWQGVSADEIRGVMK